MVNPRLAARYARSLLDLSIERNELESCYKDILYLQSLCRGSRELVNLLKSPVIPGEKKEKILDKITTGNLGEIVSTFYKLLIKKNRESFLPEILDSFVQLYKDYKGIQQVTLTTATPVSGEIREAFLGKIKMATGKEQIELHSQVDETIIGGFILEMGDRLVDASIAYDLNKIKNQFQNNDFIYKIR